MAVKVSVKFFWEVLWVVSVCFVGFLLVAGEEVLFAIFKNCLN